MESTRALHFLTQFVTDELPPSITPLQKCQLTEIVNEALTKLPQEDGKYTSLIDRVRVKKEETLNPLQILDEVTIADDRVALDPTILKVMVDYILSGKTHLHEAHLKLLCSILESPLYLTPSFPKSLFLEKVFSSLGLAHEGIAILALENFLKTVVTSQDLFHFIKMQEVSNQYQFIDALPSLQKELGESHPSYLIKLFSYFISLSAFNEDDKQMAWSLFSSSLTKISEERKDSFIDSLLLKNPTDLEEQFYTNLGLEDIYRKEDISLDHANFLSRLFLDALYKGIDRKIVEDLISSGVQNPDFINQSFFFELDKLDKEVFSCLIKYIPLFLQIDNPKNLIPEIVSLKPPHHAEQIFQILNRELAKNDRLKSISAVLEAKFKESYFTDDTKLEFLTTCLNASEPQKNALIELSKYPFFTTFSKDNLHIFLSRFTHSVDQDRLKDAFKIGYSLATSPEEFIEITSTLCQNPLRINEPLLTNLFNFMLTVPTETNFSPFTFNLFFEVMNRLSQSRDSSELHLMLINNFCSQGIDANETSFETIWFLANYCNASLELLMFIKTSKIEEQKKIFELPSFTWQHVVKYPPSEWKNLISCYELFKSKLPLEELGELWKTFTESLSKLPQNKKELLPKLLIPLIKEFEPSQIQAIVQFSSNKELSPIAIEKIIFQLNQIQTVAMTTPIVDYFLAAADIYKGPLNQDLIAALLTMAPPLRNACLTHLSLLVFLPDFSKFVEFLSLETSMDPDEKIFQAYLKTTTNTPSLASISEAFLRKEESESDDPLVKLSTIFSLTKIHIKDKNALAILTKHPNFRTLSQSFLLSLESHNHEIPEKKRATFFEQAFKLTTSANVMKELFSAYPAIEVRDDLIEKLKDLSEEDLIKAIKLLVFIPKNLQADRCHPPFNLETLTSLPPEVLENFYFPHFVRLLESTNLALVCNVTEFLFTHFMQALPPKILEDSPLGKLIINMHILSHDPDIKNPFRIFSLLKTDREKTVRVSLPYEIVEGKAVSINLDEITKTANEAMINWTYSDLARAIGREPIKTEEIRAIFQHLKARNGPQINQRLNESGLRSLEELEASICDDAESSKWHRVFELDEKVSETTLMFNACMNFYLSQLEAPSTDSLLSDSEFSLLGFLNVFIHCPTGRVEQLRTMYTALKRVLPKDFQETSTSVDYLKDYLNQIYRSELTNFLRENPNLFAKLHKGPSNVHESEYLINILGRRLGLLNGEIIFDPNTGTIPDETVNATSETLLQFILDNFTPQVLIAKMQARIALDLAEDSPIKDTLGTSFQSFLTGPEMGWFYNRVMLFDDPDPSKELVSKLFVRNLLVSKKIMEERAPLESIAKEHVSVGVDERGKLY